MYLFYQEPASLKLSSLEPDWCPGPKAKITTYLLDPQYPSQLSATIACLVTFDKVSLIPASRMRAAWATKESLPSVNITSVCECNHVYSDRQQPQSRSYALFVNCLTEIF